MKTSFNWRPKRTACAANLSGTVNKHFNHCDTVQSDQLFRHIPQLQQLALHVPDPGQKTLNTAVLVILRELLHATTRSHFSAKRKELSSLNAIRNHNL